MRFLWLALAIVTPLVVANGVDGLGSTDDLKLWIYAVVGCITEIVFIALCVSGFVDHHKQQEYVTHQKIRHDRDEDIQKWRKEFMRDSLDLYEMQTESLKRAEDMAGRPETRAAPANDFEKESTDADQIA